MTKDERPEYLTPLSGEVVRRKFLVFDIESKAGPTQKAGFTRPFMAGVYDGEVYTPFFDASDEGDWKLRWYWPGGCINRAMHYMLQRKYRGYHIYAHNGGNFDFLFLLPWLMLEGDQMGLQFRILPVASRIQVLDVFRARTSPGVVHRDRMWRFLDSYRLIPMSLDKAAKSFGMSGKLKHDLDLEDHDRRWVDYNRVDCIELYGVITKFHDYIENVLGGEVGITAPSTAMKLYRRKYLPVKLPRSIDTHSFVRSGYFGGRVEVYRAHGTGLYYYDINSSYPAAMLHPMPGGQATEWDGEPPDHMKREQIGFVEADVVVPEDLLIPPLPVRGDGDSLPKKLVFPVGNLSGVWEWDELQLALELGCEIARWKHSVWYEPVDMFGKYVRDLYQYRDKSRPDYDEGLATIAKLLLNSTYGKFATRVMRRRIYLYNDPSMPETATPASTDPDCPVFYSEEICDACYIMPQVSARVTALARVRLLRYMLDAMARGGKVYYADTDSIVTDVWMPSTTELGGIKDEIPDHAGHIRGRFLGPKMYVLDDDRDPAGELHTNYVGDTLMGVSGTVVVRGWEKVKAKGLEKRTRENVEALARGEVVMQRRLEKVGSLARAGFQRGPKMLTVPRRLRGGDEKREMLEDGSTRPLVARMF